MNELSLFTGCAGGVLGTHHLLGWKTCGYVEWNEYCQRVIAARIADGYLTSAPIFTDVREFVQSGAAEQYRGIADVVTAGFPCQPFSVAGKQAGADDERNMWPATRDVIRIVQPESVLLENVPGLISAGYLGTVIGDLAEMGYVGRWGVIGAADCDAPHRRDRLWIVAHTSRKGSPTNKHPRTSGGRKACGSTTQQGKDGQFRHVGNAEREGLEGPHHHAESSARIQQEPLQRCDNELAYPHSIGPSGSWWAFDPGNPATSYDWEVNRAFYESRWGIESGLGRVANGVANRVERLKAVGNGQVSVVAARAWQELAI